MGTRLKLTALERVVLRTLLKHHAAWSVNGGLEAYKLMMMVGGENDEMVETIIGLEVNELITRHFVGWCRVAKFTWQKDGNFSFDGVDKQSISLLYVTKKGRDLLLRG